MEAPALMSMAGLIWALGWTILGYVAGFTIERVRARLKKQREEAVDALDRAFRKSARAYDPNLYGGKG